MKLERAFALVAVVLLGGCAHKSLSGDDLSRVKRPAFISRIEENAGPQCSVFRDDGKAREKLQQKLDAKEADRRLATKLGKGMSRFEISDRLRASTFSRLPRERPWTNTVEPARVASVLESYLVDEVPANAPDYELLRPVGVDGIVEFVIESYGMRGENGGGYPYFKGYARMFMLGGGEIWRAPIDVDAKREGREPLDPLAVAKEPEQFRAEMTTLLDQMGEKLSLELTPKVRRVTPDVAPGKAADDLASPPDDTNRTGKENKKSEELPPGELPAPEPSPKR